MDFDGPRSPPQTLPQDILRTCSLSAPTPADEAAFPVLRNSPSGHLSAEAVALIRGDVPAERKRLLYSNSLRRRSLEVEAVAATAAVVDAQ